MRQRSRRTKGDGEEAAEEQHPRAVRQRGHQTGDGGHDRPPPFAGTQPPVGRPSGRHARQRRAARTCGPVARRSAGTGTAKTPSPPDRRCRQRRCQRAMTTRAAIDASAEAALRAPTSRRHGGDGSQDEVGQRPVADPWRRCGARDPRPAAGRPAPCRLSSMPSWVDPRSHSRSPAPTRTVMISAIAPDQAERPVDAGRSSIGPGDGGSHHLVSAARSAHVAQLPLEVLDLVAEAGGVLEAEVGRRPRASPPRG